jgi:hypothetical protein
MNKGDMSKDEALKIYQECRKIDVDKWKDIFSPQAVEFVKRVCATKSLTAKDLEQIPDSILKMNLLLMARVAHEVNPQDFMNYLTKGEMPPIKMRPDEMEAMKAGLGKPWFKSFIATGFLVGAGLSMAS